MASVALLSLDHSLILLHLPGRYPQFLNILTGMKHRSQNESKERESVTEVINKVDVVGDDVSDGKVAGQEFSNGFVGLVRSLISNSVSGDSLNLGIRELVYEVVEVRSDGNVSTRKNNETTLVEVKRLYESVMSMDFNQHAILLNFGSLRAIAMQENVYIFNYNRFYCGKAFIDALLPRLKGPSMPYILEVVEAALHSQIQRLEQRLWDLESRVQALLEVLPNRLTGDILEELRISKQRLVELGSRAGATKQMLLDILEDTHEIRRICIMGRNCTLQKNDEMECSVLLEEQIAEEEEEEIEMLLENYLQRCESCHGQAERLLDSAKEMEDSIAVNLSSRRLEVSRVELFLQVGTFCIAVGALVAGIFGMNLKSYLEERAFAFWITTAGIIVGAVIVFIPQEKEKL
ncbi:magnesium transporter MRS2-11, chloroplastic [Olea europaea subsp. europaea]|uniref:Magnesium transporter n=1 Tax=Olea europaea subsp. europaea TaxID=158383 RepID=A0A8S0TU41_OLEEU|nr:magnesium transporter MRS2-11, chloroplastic [Olea europaea subsp. europaea]